MRDLWKVPYPQPPPLAVEPPEPSPHPLLTREFEFRRPRATHKLHLTPKHSRH